MAKFKTCSTIKETLKQQVLSAVDPIYYQDLEDDTFGYADVLIPAIIQHLTTTYGTLTASKLIETALPRPGTPTIAYFDFGNFGPPRK